MMTPLGTIFRPGSNKPPKIDQHSLFTSIQVSVAILEGDLQIYEPWRRKRNRPKQCHVTLYANETSPFLVWHKSDKGKNAQPVGKTSGSENPTASTFKPRCVISVSRAKLAKTTGGSFEMTDFASNLTFRFIAKTIREAEMWVEKLAEESLREANLDMRSICSSCSSFSSSTSFPSPIATPASDSSRRFFAPCNRNVVKLHRKSASFSDATGAIMQLLERDEMQQETAKLPSDDCLTDHSDQLTNGEDFFAVKSTAAHIAASELGHIPSSSKTLPRAQNSKASAARWKQAQHHIRAQPHLGLSIVSDKHRPELSNVVTEIPCQSKAKANTLSRSDLPFSEYFVHMPDS